MIWYHPSTSPPSWPACCFIKICHRLTNWLTLALIGLPRSQKWTPRYVQMKIYYFIFTYFLASCPCKLALWQKSNLDFWQDRRLHIQKSQILTRIKMWNEKLKRLYYCVLNLYDVFELYVGSDVEKMVWLQGVLHSIPLMALLDSCLSDMYGRSSV